MSTAILSVEILTTVADLYSPKLISVFVLKISLFFGLLRVVNVSGLIKFCARVIFLAIVEVKYLETP